MNLHPKTLYNVSHIKLFLCLLIFSFLPFEKLEAQGCECVGCSGPIDVNSTSSYVLNISGATNNVLNSPGQGVCGVFLDLNFPHIWSLTITLTAPSGDIITLMGPYDNFPGTTLFSNWDISFLPCADPVDPDLMPNGIPFTDQWSNLQNWGVFTNYTGSYYPYIGCLEDFGGTVDGDWVLTITNGSMTQGGGTLNGWSLLFCDESGLGCSGCTANAGDLSGVNDFEICEGDSFNGSIAPFYNFGEEPNNQYSYTYIIAQNSIIQNYDEAPDFSTFATGTYEVCGLSYLTSDLGSIPSPNGMMTVADLDNMLLNNPPFCGDISDDCIQVTISPYPDMVYIDDTFCEGEDYVLGGNSFNTEGVYIVTLPAPNNCDTTVELTLTEVFPNTINLESILCEGDTFFISNNFFIATGSYTVNLTNVFGCDSTVNLDLTVLTPDANIAPPLTINCNNSSVELDGSNSSMGGDIAYQWNTVNGNIIGNITENTITVDAAGKYFLSVTSTLNGVNCTVVDSVQVDTSLTIPLVNAGVDSLINCAITSIVLDGSGTSTGSNFSYEWTTTSGNIIQDTFTLNALIDSGGTYVLNVVNDDNGCSAEDSILILQNTVLPISNAGVDAQVNCDNPTLDLDGSGSSQGMAFVYQWISSDGNILLGETTLQPTIDSAGSYELLVTDSINFCTALDTVEISIDTIAPIVDTGADILLDCAIPTNQLDGTGSSQGSNFSFQWITISGANLAGGENTLTPSVDSAGVYELVIENDLTGCTASSQVTVNESFIVPVIDVLLPIDTITCNQPIIEIDASNSSVGNDFLYEWTEVGTGNIVSGETTLQPQIDQAGTYQLEISNTFNNCVTTETFEVFANNAIPSINAGQDLVITCDEPEVILNGSGDQGNEFEYLWTPSNGGNIVSGFTSLTPTVNAAGDYEIQITNITSGCTQVGQVNVTVDTIVPIADAGSNILLDCAMPTNELDGTNSSQGNNFSYQWTTLSGANLAGGETTLTPAVNGAGVYQLVVENDLTGCTASSQVTVTQSLMLPMIDVVTPIDTITCNVPVIEIDASNSTSGIDYQYQWTVVGDGNIQSGENTLQPQIDEAGTYQLEILNTINNCVAIGIFEVIANNSLPNVDAGNEMTINCYDPQIVLNGSGDQGNEFEYLWTPSNGGNVLLNQNTLSPTVDAAGTYELQVTNTISGCTQTDAVLVVVDTIPPIANAGLDTLVNCYNPSIQLDGSGSTQGNMEYLWSTSNGSTISNSSSLQPVISSFGNYELLVTNIDNGCSSFDSVFVGENFTLPLANAGQDTFINCANPTVQLNGTESSIGINFSYQWTATNGGVILADGNTLTPEVEGVGIYELIVFDSDNGCSITDEVEVIDVSIFPTADAGISQTLDCNQTILTLDGTNSSVGNEYNYQWTTVNGNIILGDDTLAPQVDSAGTYVLTVTHLVDGCTTEDFVEIFADTLAPIADAGIDDELTCTVSFLNLDGTASDQGNNFSYEWTTFSGTGTVSNPNSLTPQVDTQGAYQLEVTNLQNGCTTTDVVFVLLDTIPPIADAGQDAILNCGTPSVNLGGNSSSGVDFSYNWTVASGGNITSNPSEITVTANATGNYFLTVTDLANGCTASDLVVVTEDFELPIAEAIITDTIFCSSSTITLDGTGSSIGANFSYLWTTTNGNILTDSTTLFPIINFIGDYTLTVTNLTNNCTAIATTNVVAENCIPQVVVDVNGIIDCNQPTLILDGTGSSVGPQYIYQWTTNDGNIIQDDDTLYPTIDSGGTYVLTITNLFTGDMASDSVLVDEMTELPIVVLSVNELLTCEDTIVLINSTGSTSGIGFTYSWTTNTGNILSGGGNSLISVNEPGWYYLEISNINTGCFTVDSIEVIQDVNAPIANAGSDLELNCYNNQLFLDGGGSSFGNNFTYQWTTNTGNILSGADGINPQIDSSGIYILEVSDLTNGCTSQDTVIISENFDLPIAMAGMPDTINCNQLSLNLDGTGSSVGNEFTYFWDTDIGNILFGDSTLNPLVNTEGNYELIVTDTTNGCSSSADVDIAADLVFPIANGGGDIVLECGLASITLDANNSSIGTALTYEWTTLNGNILSGDSTLTPEVNAGGTYVLEIQNTQNGCSSTDVVEVTEDDCTPIAIIATPDILTCTQTQITIDGSSSSSWGTIVYQWTNPNGNVIGNDNPFVTVNLPGDYQLLITDTLTNLSDAATVTVFISNDLPLADAGETDTLNCANVELNLNGSGSSLGNEFVYLWETIDGNILSGASGLSPLVDSSGTYNLTVTNNITGCASTSFVFIEIDNIVPLVMIENPNQLNCVDTMLQLNAVGSSVGNNFTYQWETFGGNFITGLDALTPQIDAAGTYELTVINNDNFCEASQQVIVQIDTILPTVLIENPAELDCNLTMTQLDATGSSVGVNFSYEWTTSNGNIINGNNSLTPEIDLGGDYALTILNTQNGCEDSLLIMVLQDTILPIADAGIGLELTCIDSVLNLDGSNSSTGSEFQYQWTTQNGFIINGENTLLPSINLPGEYELMVTNTDNNCTVSSIVEVTQDIVLPIAQINTPDTLNCLVENIQIDASDSSNGLIFNYLWSTGDGLVDFGETTLTPQVSEGGSYELLITNTQNGCTIIATTEVVQDTILPISEAGTSMTLTCVDTIFNLNGNGSSIGNEFSYLWTSQNGNIISGDDLLNPLIDAPGIYQMQVLNNNNQCTSMDEVEVLENISPPQIEINAIGGLTLNCDISSIVLDGSGSIPLGNVSFDWNTSTGNILSGSLDPNPEVDLAGNYVLTLTNDINGCTSIESITILEDFELPQINIELPDDLTCVDTVITLTAAGSSNGFPFENTWTTATGNILSGVNDLESEIDAPGIYTLNILNTENGCSVSDSVEVMEDVMLPFVDAGGIYEMGCTESEVTLNAFAAQGNEFIYEWTTANGNILSGNSTLAPTVVIGNYVLTVTNQDNGCENTSEAQVLEDMDVPNDIEVILTDPLCFGDSNGNIEILNVIGGEAPYVFSFNNQAFDTNSNFGNLSGGVYPLTVQDATGCEWSTELDLIEPIEVMVELGDDQFIELGENITLQAINNIPNNDLDSITWLSSGALECENCLEQNVLPLFTTTYSVWMSNTNGCDTEDNVTIYVNNKKRIFIPNAFSPNDDGYNDVFMIYGGVGIEEIEQFQIFSRWGELVFEQSNFQPNDSAMGWDGYFKGKKMNPSVFVYFAKIRYINGKTEIFKGDLYLK